MTKQKIESVDQDYTGKDYTVCETLQELIYYLECISESLNENLFLSLVSRALVDEKASVSDGVKRFLYYEFDKVREIEIRVRGNLINRIIKSGINKEDLHRRARSAASIINEHLIYGQIKGTQKSSLGNAKC